MHPDAIGVTVTTVTKLINSVPKKGLASAYFDRIFQQRRPSSTNVASESIPVPTILKVFTRAFPRKTLEDPTTHVTSAADIVLASVNSDGNGDSAVDGTVGESGGVCEG